jgi:hypothetical protein
MFNRTPKTSKHVLSFMKSTQDALESFHGTNLLRNDFDLKVIDWLKDLETRLKPIEKVTPDLATVAEFTFQINQSQNSSIESLHERLEFLEDLLRNNYCHESTCNISVAAAHNSRGMSYMVPQPCNCWLADDDLPTDDES